MPVKVDIVGRARDLFDRPSYALDFKPGMTVGGVLKELSARSGRGEALFDAAAGGINEHYTIFVNSREIRSLQGPDTKLKESDVITVLPPMAGG